MLRALVDAVEADPRWDALDLGCNLAACRTDADVDADLDVGLWHLPGGVLLALVSPGRRELDQVGR